MPDTPIEVTESLPITVAIVEDVPTVREGLAALIDGTPGYRCVGRYRSMEEAIAGVSTRPPAVVLTDIGLPGMSGIDGVRILRQKHPGLLLLMLSVYDDDDRVFDAICAGACGYLLKKTPPGQLLESIRDAVAGGAPMSREVARRVIDLFREVRPPAKADFELTPHEQRILRLLADGHSYKSAAETLNVTVHTISFYLRQIYEKLQVHSKSEAVAKALRHRVI